MDKVAAEIVVVGAGPAGLAAAVSASKYSHVMVVDDNPLPGGQVWRAELGVRETKYGLLSGQSGSREIEFLNGTTVWGTANKVLYASVASGPIEIAYEKCIIATGARERFLPFPGWTLPNVMGVGGLQAMVKGGLTIAGKRVVIAGTGPLLFAVAEHLKRKGAKVLAIAEQTTAVKVSWFAIGLLINPGKLAQATKLRVRLIGVPYLTSSWITSAFGDGRLQRVELIANGKRRSIACDYLACGYHLMPNSELARLLGCRIEDGFVAVDDHQRTSVENVYCAGETTGIAGIESALLEGEIAGRSATGQTHEVEKLFSKREKARSFGIAIDKAFALRKELRHLADDNTFVCRCEDVTFGRLKLFKTFREAKLQTRCGMGPCQGRVCGDASQFLFGWEPPSVRPPIFPVKLEHL